MAYLDVTGGHRLYWERQGTGAIPAMWLHGGPGSGMRAAQAELFDLNRYDLVLFDQRGAGRSEPSASKSLKALEHNTTQHLISDIDALRRACGWDQMLVCGGSWGSCLAMAYALSHPDRVLGLVLAGVATSARDDLHWLYGDVGAFFPEAHAAWCAHVPDAQGTAARLTAYDTALRGPDAQAAADSWATWEMAIFDTHWSTQPGSPWAHPDHRLGFARLCAHYFARGCFMPDMEIEYRIAEIAHIPATLIHSRFDPSAPLRTPWRLAQNWPAATLEILPGGDHSALSDQMKSRIRAATDRIAMKSAGLSGRTGT